MTGENKSTFDASPIAALATATGPAGLCVVRISGVGALEIGDRLVSEAKKPSHQKAGTFFYARIIHPETKAFVDDGILLIFRAPHSFTGEDTLEIQGHGGLIPARALLDAVLAAGARLAEPGEFTKRAFLNGRLDLTQAEAVCDFIQAKTDRAADIARSHLEGMLGKRIDALYLQLTTICAGIEHLLDFDEGELPDRFLETSRHRLNELVVVLDGMVRSWQENHWVRDGAAVVIGGRPNAGKSSLMNALLGRARAIVHAEPGTTRDVIEDVFTLQGVPLRLVDTAGLRSTDNAVEREGIARARDAIRHADLTLYLVDATASTTTDDEEALRALVPEKTILVLTKTDLPQGAETRLPEGFSRVRISSVTRSGLDELGRAILDKLGVGYDSTEQPVVSLRQAEELRCAFQSVHQAAALLTSGDQMVLAANHLRRAAEALGRIIGRVYSDDLLDTIFNRFCVGK
jgi:tRNA modification GTPase